MGDLSFASRKKKSTSRRTSQRRRQQYDGMLDVLNGVLVVASDIYLVAKGLFGKALSFCQSVRVAFRRRFICSRCSAKKYLNCKNDCKYW